MKGRPGIAVTGWAWRTPLGNSIDGAAARLLEGERAATSRHHFDASSYSCRLGAPIPGEPPPSRHHRFVDRMGRWAAPIPGEPPPSRHHRFVDRMGRWAMGSAIEALAMAGRQGGERLGLFAAVGGLRAHWDEMMPALERQAAGAQAWERGLRLLHPFWMLRYLSNNAHALLAADLDARGEGLTFGGANAGAAALASAGRSLARGSVDACLVMAYDSLLTPETLTVLGARGSVARVELDRLEAPYGSRAGGFVPGEAAAALVVERRDEAGDRTLGWLDAAAVADGQEGEPAAETIARAAARVAAGERVVDGAARAQPDLDALEREALARHGGLDPDADLCAITAAMGQVGAATPVVQAIALGACLRRGALPRIAGLKEAAPGPLRPVIATKATGERTAIAVATGAPGLAAALRVEVP